MRLIFLSLLLLAASTKALGAEGDSAAAPLPEGSSNVDTALTKALIKQIEELNEEKELEQQDQIRALREKYPGLMPPHDRYHSLKFYNQIFDATLTNTIFFAPGSSYLSEIQIQKIEAISDALLEAPEALLVIEGHSANNYQIEDAEERLFYNRWISGRRAVKVWNYLTSERGIDPIRIVMYAYDAQRTLNNERTETQRALNRRVEMRLTNQAVGLTGIPGSTSPTPTTSQQQLNP